MPIVRYDPFRDLRTLQEEVNRLFSTNLSRDFGEEGNRPGRVESKCRHLREQGSHRARG